MADPKKKKETPVTTSQTTAIELAKAQLLLPEEVVFDELIENFKEMDEIEFPRLRFKTGKFYFSDDPSDRGVEEFDGVILFYGRQNTYWEGTFDVNNIIPPECFSVDGVTGTKPRDAEGKFGKCEDCVLNKFKSSSNGKGKACRNQEKLYIQVLGTAVPTTLFLAPTSIGGFLKNFIMQKVTQKALNYFKIVTRFKAVQQDRETFFRINFEVVGVYKGEEAETVKKLRDFWLPAIKRDRSRLDASVGSHMDDAQPQQQKPQASNVRTVTPRQAPAPAQAPAKSMATAEPEEDNNTGGVVDEEEPPF